MSVTIEQITSIHSVLKSVYPSAVRPIIKSLIDDPDSSIDDYILKVLDIIMGYDEEEE